jgi:hypothetical protein
MRTPAADIDMPNVTAAIAYLDDTPSSTYPVMATEPAVHQEDAGYIALAAEVVTLAIRDFVAQHRTGKQVRLDAGTAGLPAAAPLTSEALQAAAAAGHALARDAGFQLWCAVLDADPRVLIDGALAVLAEGRALALRKFDPAEDPRETAEDDDAA